MTAARANRRQALTALGLAMTQMCAPVAASGPVLARIVSPFPAGGSFDVWLRALQQGLEGLGRGTVTVAYVPGASGAVAANQLMEAPGDQPTTLLMAGSAVLSVLPLQADSGLRRDPHEHLLPLAVLWEEPMLLTVRADSPHQHIGALWAATRAPGASISHATVGTGSTGGVCLSHMGRRQGFTPTQVPFRGMVDVATQLLGGHVDVGWLTYQQARAHVERRALRVLATSGPVRSALLPATPTLMEAGLADHPCVAWVGLLVRKDTPAALRERLSDDLAGILSSAALRQTMTDNGYTVLGLFGRDAQTHAQRSHDTWRAVLAR